MWTNRIANVLSHPQPLRNRLFRYLRRRVAGYERDHYRFIVEAATREAVVLEIPKISVMEFGVAGGNGLVDLERICRFLRKKYPIDFEIYGFDLGSGLPQPDDFRDAPYLWEPEFYQMDVARLKAQLEEAQLILGDVVETANSFFAKHDPAPVGAIAFDLDYYSSTSNAFRIFEGGHEYLMPRIFCYFDDLGMIPSLGEQCAIRDFNSNNGSRRLEQNPETVFASAAHTLRGWQVFEYHDFQHPLWGLYVREKDGRLSGSLGE